MGHVSQYVRRVVNGKWKQSVISVMPLGDCWAARSCTWLGRRSKSDGKASMKWFRRRKPVPTAATVQQETTADATVPSVSSPPPARPCEPRDFTEVLTPELCRNIFGYVDLKSKVRSEAVCKKWRSLITDSYSMDKWSAWLYVIFREGHMSGHDRVAVKISQDGPIFWNQSIVYVYMCSCHVYERHEPQWTSLFKRIGPHVRRLCLVTSPARSAFLTNDFYLFCLDTFPQLEILYMRELNLETVATSTVEKLASSKSLRRIIVHKCVSCDTLTDFHRLNDRLMIVRGDLRGLEELLKSKDAYPDGCDLEPLINGLVVSADVEPSDKVAVPE